MSCSPYTERSNPITENIDVSSPSKMVQLLGQTDEEIFTGVAMEENLFSQGTIQAITDAAGFVQECLRHHKPENVAIVLSGCGTSGRLGFLISKVCNELAKAIVGEKPFYYSVAGGDKSILTSQEAPEDDPEAGASSLLKICRGKKKVIYFGITCGVSAPFVGGQLDYCMKNLDVFTPVLLGFNPIAMARNVQITGWSKTMRDVATEMQVLQKRGKAFIINPVLGGEAITGSSRMKGGTATKIILETIFLSALNGMETVAEERISQQDIVNILHLYRDICEKFYKSEACDVMASLVQRSGTALKSGGAVRYLATGWTGVIPVIDSTECPPTFGSSVNDVRGFVHGGYGFLGIEDFGEKDKNFQLGFGDFTALYDDHEIRNDEAIFFIQSSCDPLLTALKRDLGTAVKGLKARRPDKTAAVSLQRPNEPLIDDTEIASCFSEVYRVPLPDFNAAMPRAWGDKCRRALEDSLYGCCLKWLVNAISTGGHVLLGKVYKNYMCDVKVSNNKLYHRAIGIIERMCPEVSLERATDSLLKSIYETDSVTPDIRSKPVAEHYKTAAPKDKVVPLAIILSKLDCTVDFAKQTLKRYSVIRNAVSEITGK